MPRNLTLCWHCVLTFHKHVLDREDNLTGTLLLPAQIWHCKADVDRVWFVLCWKHQQVFFFFAFSLKWKYLMMSWCVGAVTFLHCYSSGTLWAHCAFLFVLVPYFRADPHTDILVICKNVAFKCNWQSKSFPVSTDFQSLTRVPWELAAQREKREAENVTEPSIPKFSDSNEKEILIQIKTKYHFISRRRNSQCFPPTQVSLLTESDFSLSECGIRGNASDSHRKLDKTFWSE